jgi:Tol biopolymer transport system component
MDELGVPAASPHTTAERGARLDSWKEIAAHLNRDVRTVQRWEKVAALPVRRLQKPGLRAVFAYTADLDEWLRHQDLQAVEAAADTTRTEAVTDEPAETAAMLRPRSRARLLYAVVAVMLVVTAVITFWPRRAPPLVLAGARPLTSEPGIERDPDLSPDGKYVAYVSESADLRTRLQVRLLTGGEPRKLTSASDDEWSPAWSPDGGRIAFLRGDPGGTATLLLMSALGGEERAVAEVRPYPRRRTLLIGHLLAWTPDGRHIVAADQDVDGRRGLFLVSTDTGSRMRLTSPPSVEFDVEPSLSSDGRVLLFNRIRGQTSSDVYVQPLDAAFHPAGPLRRLPPAGSWNGTPRLLEDRQEVLMSAGSVPRLALWRQPFDGSGTPVSLGIIGDNAVQSAVHQATGRIVSRTFKLQYDVLRLPLDASRAAAPQDPPVQSFLESTFVDRSPAYSPEGREVAFISDRTGRRQLWVSDSAGEKPVEWTQLFEADFWPPAWSPDGSRLVFTGAGPAGLNQLFVADRSTRAAVRVTDDALDYANAVWSSDGTSLYAAAAAGESPHALYRVRAGGGPAEKIAAGYDYVTGIDPSGQGLYVGRRARRNQAELLYLRLSTGQATHLATLNFLEDAWVTRDGIYYLDRSGDDPLSPVALSFRTHAGATRIVQGYTEPPGRGLSVSPDGRFAITTGVVPPDSDLFLLDIAR